MVMLTPKMQMVGCRSATYLAFEGEGGGGTLVSGLQIYFCKYIFSPESISFLYMLRVRTVGDACRLSAKIFNIRFICWGSCQVGTAEKLVCWSNRRSTSPRTTTSNQPASRASNELARPICAKESMFWGKNNCFWSLLFCGGAKVLVRTYQKTNVRVLACRLVNSIVWLLCMVAPTGSSSDQVVSDFFVVLSREFF